MNDNSHVSDSPVAASSTRDFALWALETLKCPVQETADGECSFSVAEDHRDQFDGAERVQLHFAPNGEANGHDPQVAGLVSPSSGLFQWLVSELRDTVKVASAAPRNVAESVHALSPRLFECYELEEGHIQLAGCTLEDWPLLRLTFRQGGAIVHLFYERDGTPVDPRLRDSLHLNDLAPVTRRTRDLNDDAVQQWTAAVEPLARKTLGGGVIESGDVESGDIERIAVTLVWCKFAEGKLAFSIGEAHATTTFSGWAQHFADGIAKPPPFRCPQTGRESYHLAATDEHQITVAGAIKICRESGRRLIVSELEECAATGEFACPEFFETCPVSGERVLRSAFVECGMCGESVSPTAVQRERCMACRALRTVGKDEPTVVRLLDEYPKLDRWRGWQLSETAKVYVFVASALLKSLMIVVDKQDFGVRRLATRGRFSRNWTTLEDEALAGLLLE